MDTLPQELIDKISSYLDRDDLKSTLTLSRRFCFAAERSSRAFSNCSLKEADLDRFRQIYSGYRIRYLEMISFRTYFAPVKRPYPNCRENKAQLQEKDENFTKQISSLFFTLKALEDRWRGNYELCITAPTTWLDARPCKHHLWPSWRVHLLNPDTLPELYSVHKLWVATLEDCDLYRSNSAPSKLDWRVLVDLMVKFPRLESFLCHLGGNEWSQRLDKYGEPAHYTRDWEGPRRDSRHGFGEAMVSMSDRIPKRLRQVYLDFMCGDAQVVDHRMSMPNLMSPATYDPFSCGLRLLSSNLRQMRIRASVDQTLFWPLDTAASPMWPNLESLEVLFHPVHPSGSWYFEGPLGEGAGAKGFTITESSYPPLETTDEDRNADREPRRQRGMHRSQFRVKPTHSQLLPLLEAFARAAANMPSLLEFLIWAPLFWEPEPDDPLEPANSINDLYPGSKNPLRSFAWAIAYAAPQVYAGETSPGERYSKSRQMWWKVGEWRPDAVLHQLFQQIGEEKYGNALIEYWGGEKGSHVLPDRWDVENKFAMRMPGRSRP